MPGPVKLPSGIRRLFRLPPSEERRRREVDEEVRFHLEMRVAALRARGMSAADAEAEARRMFGDVEDLRAHSARTGQSWRVRAAEWMGEWWRIIAFAGRRLRSSPAFTIGVTLTLAIAIGGTASVFAVVNGVLLKAFPYRAARPGADGVGEPSRSRPAEDAIVAAGLRRLPGADPFLLGIRGRGVGRAGDGDGPG